MCHHLQLRQLRILLSLLKIAGKIGLPANVAGVGGGRSRQRADQRPGLLDATGTEIKSLLAAELEDDRRSVPRDLTAVSVHSTPDQAAVYRPATARFGYGHRHGYHRNELCITAPGGADFREMAVTQGLTSVHRL